MTPWPDSMPALAERVALIPRDRTVDEVVDRLTTIERDRDGFFSPDGGGPDARRANPPGGFLPPRPGAPPPPPAPPRRSRTASPASTACTSRSRAPCATRSR